MREKYCASDFCEKDESTYSGQMKGVSPKIKPEFNFVALKMKKILQ